MRSTASMEMCANTRVRTHARKEKILGEIRRQVGEEVSGENLFRDYSSRGMCWGEEVPSFQKRTNRPPPRDRNAARSNFQPRNLRREDRLLALHGKGNREIWLQTFHIVYLKAFIYSIYSITCILGTNTLL